MINLIIVILFLHWVADFVLQSDWQATNKSSNNRALISHTLVYSGVFVIPACLYLGIEYGCYFTLITFMLHSLTDYFTSRLNSRLWADKKVHYFFVSIGFDQFLHFTQLLLTFYYLSK